MNRARILVFEADERVNRSIATALQSTGFEVLTALDRGAALCAIDEGGLDFALADIGAPQIDDLEVVRSLAAARVAFVVMSLREDPAQIHRAVEMGAMGYFLKPLDVPLIVPSIRPWIARATELQQLGAGRQSVMEALQNNRSIGTAVGIIMERHQMSADRAFETLRRQARNERLSVIRLATRIVARVTYVGPPVPG